MGMLVAGISEVTSLPDHPSRLWGSTSGLQDLQVYDPVV